MPRAFYGDKDNKIIKTYDQTEALAYLVFKDVKAKNKAKNKEIKGSSDKSSRAISYAKGNQFISAYKVIELSTSKTLVFTTMNIFTFEHEKHDLKNAKAKEAFK